MKTHFCARFNGQYIRSTGKDLIVYYIKHSKLTTYMFLLLYKTLQQGRENTTPQPSHLRCLTHGTLTYKPSK